MHLLRRQGECANLRGGNGARRRSARSRGRALGSSPRLMPSAAAERWLILVVEDDPLIAMMLEDMLDELRCTLLGPAPSVLSARAVWDQTADLEGGVLDCTRTGERVWPVADRLRERGVPFVFSTGYGVAGIEPRFGQIPVLAKPYPVELLGEALLPQLTR